MRARLCFVSAILLLAGCVAYVHDEKVDRLKPAPVQLSQFAGTYVDEASYHTPPNKMGLMGHTTLGGAIRSLQFGANVLIEVDSSGNISVSAPGSKYNPGVIYYAKGKDFDFVDHRIVFKSEGRFGSHDSPGIGGYKKQMQWMLDEAGRLVVVSSSKGGGLVGVIPVAVGGSTLGIFDRTKGLTSR